MSLRLRSVGGWLTLSLTVIIFAALGANHFIHGPGCWGLQPGGLISMWLYAVQLLLAFGSSIFAVFIFFKEHPSNWRAITFRIVTLSGLTAYLLIAEGYWIFTSAHRQGIDNLVPFLTATIASIYASLQLVEAGRAG